MDEGICMVCQGNMITDSIICVNSLIRERWIFHRCKILRNTCSQLTGASQLHRSWLPLNIKKNPQLSCKPCSEQTKDPSTHLIFFLTWNPQKNRNYIISRCESPFPFRKMCFFFSTSPFLDILSLDVSGGVQNSKPRTRPGRNVQTPWKPSYEDSWPFGPDLLQLGLDFIELGLTSSRCQKGPPMGRKNPPGLPKKGPAFEGKAIILHYHSHGNGTYLPYMKGGFLW